MSKPVLKNLGEGIRAVVIPQEKFKTVAIQPVFGASVDKS